MQDLKLNMLFQISKHHISHIKLVENICFITKAALRIQKNITTCAAFCSHCPHFGPLILFSLSVIFLCAMYPMVPGPLFLAGATVQ